MTSAPDMLGRHRRIRRTVVLILLMAVVVVVSWAAAVAGFFAAATVFDTVVALFVLAGIAGLAIGGTSSWLVARATRRARPRRYAGGVGLLAVVLLAVLASVTVLRPLPSMPASHRPPSPPAAVKYWQLSTGSRLAYLKTPAVGTPRGTPIVVVGGGPGEASVANQSQVRFFGRFARLGHDVYTYDQVGAGFSSRLADPAAYTVRRHVADLEAIRERIGAARMILMGSSWGGSLVASYLARYPEHVAKAVFTSPAPMNYARWPKAGDPASHLPAPQRHQAQALLPNNPRFVLWYALGGVNPNAAHNLVSDREADAYFDTYLHVIRPATVCDPAHLPDTYETGNGFYDNIFTTRSAVAGHQQAGVTSALAKTHTQALILTGGCNYVPWPPTRQYATILPNATLACFPHAGHVIYLDKPKAYEQTIGSFLRGTELRSWPTDRPCTT